MKLWQAGGFAFATLGGTILHFLYDWTGNSVFVAPFSGVNESTWEHMKLLYFPLLLFALVQSRFFRDRKNFWCVKLLGTVLGLTLIPVLFYTIHGIVGDTPDWVNISIFYVTAAMVYFVEYRLFVSGWSKKCRPKLAFGALCLIGALFVLFTFVTPQLPLFQDPISGSYGYFES